MIMIVAFLVVLALVPLFGGKFEGLAEIHVRKPGMIGVAIVMQVGVFFLLAGKLSPSIFGLLHLLSYAPAAYFVWSNRQIKGMALMVLGGSLNLAAIAANGGVMPARPGALETAGLADLAGLMNSAAVQDPKLWFLGDVFAIPKGFPFANVFSIGDLLLVVGAGILVHHAAGSKIPSWLREAKPVAAGITEIVDCSSHHPTIGMALQDGKICLSSADALASVAARHEVAFERDVDHLVHAAATRSQSELEQILERWLAREHQQAAAEIAT